MSVAHTVHVVSSFSTNQIIVFGIVVAVGVVIASEKLSGRRFRCGDGKRKLHQGANVHLRFTFHASLISRGDPAPTPCHLFCHRAKMRDLLSLFPSPKRTLLTTKSTQVIYDWHTVSWLSKMFSIGIISIIDTPNVTPRPHVAYLLHGIACRITIKYGIRTCAYCYDLNPCAWEN